MVTEIPKLEGMCFEIISKIKQTDRDSGSNRHIFSSCGLTMCEDSQGFQAHQVEFLVESCWRDLGMWQK